MITFRSIWRDPIHFVACGFGLGASPIMPGTFGTLFGVLIFLMIAKLDLLPYLLITTALIVIGVYLCGRTSRDFGVDDHSSIVWDEIASFPLVMAAIPITWYYLLAGFIIFRAVDIVKPWPIDWLERRVRGGFGVMLDDMLSAFAAWVVLYCVTLI